MSTPFCLRKSETKIVLNIHQVSAILYEIGWDEGEVAAFWSAAREETCRPGSATGYLEVQQDWLVSKGKASNEDEKVRQRYLFSLYNELEEWPL